MSAAASTCDQLMNGRKGWFARLKGFRYSVDNTPATLSPVPTGDAHNWRVFIA